MKHTKTSILLTVLLFIAAVTTAQTTVDLAWDYTPATVTNVTHDPVSGAVTGSSVIKIYPDTFILRGTKQANASLTTWPVLVIFDAMQTNIATGAFAVRTNYTVTAIPHGSYFFVITASNSGGESFFSNTALRKPGAEPPANLSAAKGQ